MSSRQNPLGGQSVRLWIIGLYGLHSFIGLVYQIVWLRLLAAQFGRTLMAMGLVFAVYMAGLGLGAALVATWSRSRGLPVRRAFVGAQLLLGLGGASFPSLLSWLDQYYMTLAPPTESLALNALRLVTSAAFLFILATVTGTIFPMLSPDRTDVARDWTGSYLGWLYWSGLIGAAMGALMTPLVLIPTFGYAMTTVLLVSLSVMSALGGLLCLKPSPRRPATISWPPSQRTPVSMRVICWLSFGVGACFFAVEHVAAAYLWLIVDATVYAEGILVGTTLFCMGAGALAYLVLSRLTVPLTTLLASGFLILATSQLLWLLLAGDIAKGFEAILKSGAGLPLAALRFFATQSLLVIITIGIPATVAGLALATLYDLCARHGSGANSVGRVTAWHYGGAIVGSVGAAFVLIPAAGMTLSLCVTSAIALVMAGACLSRSPRFARWPRLTWAAVAGFSAAILATSLVTDLTFRDRAAGNLHEVAWWHEDGGGVVEVYRERDSGHQTLRSSRLRQEGGDRPTDLQVERLQGALPVLLHPAPKRVLVVGLGTGISVAASLRPEVEQLTCVELSQGVIHAAAHFRHANGDLLNRPNVTLVHEDGRSFAQRQHHTYDLIVQDLFFPYRSGVGTLYTLEHYQRLRDRLAPQGRAAQWIALNQLGQLELQSLIRTFSHVFPETSLWLTGGYLMLYGGSTPLRVDWDAWHQRVSEQPPLSDSDSTDTLGMFIASGEAVRQWATHAPLNTDDNALIEFRAPRAFERLNSVELAVANLSSLLPLHQRVTRLFDTLSPEPYDRLKRASQASQSLLRGIIARAHGDINGARVQYEQAYALNPVNFQVRQFLQADFAMRGRQAHLGHRYAEAESLLERAIELDPTLPNARFDLALVAAKRQDHARAIVHLRALLHKHPKFPHAHFNLGVSLYHLGRYAEAAAQFTHALERAPDSADAHFNLANSLAQAGQYEEAVETYQHTLTLAPNHQTARDNLNAILSWRRNRSNR